MLLDYLYPPACILCGELLPLKNPSENTGEKKKCFQRICAACRNNVPVITGATCMRCGKPVESKELEYCFDCKEKDFAFQRNRSVFVYEGAVRRAMHDLKYAQCKENAFFFEEKMRDCLGLWMKSLNVDVVIPIPLHIRRKRRRGYNQAQLLAEGIADYLGVPMDVSVLIRCAATKPQKELDKGERKINLKNAFKIGKNEVQYERVLLIDDIYTTGATLEGAARVLKTAGIREVYSVTACIGKGY